jgi:hypothetical protein
MARNRSVSRGPRRRTRRSRRQRNDSGPPLPALSIEEIARRLRWDQGEVRDKIAEVGGPAAASALANSA